MKRILFVFCVLFSICLLGQGMTKAVSVEQGTFLRKTIPLRDFAKVNTDSYKGSSSLKIIPNNLRGQTKNDPSGLPLGADPIGQRNFSTNAQRAPQANFDGANQAEGAATPPDPTGAVGPNHYVQAVNLVVKIFDKQGNLLVGPTRLSDFLSSSESDGDPIVMYDHLVDRFFVSQFQQEDVDNGLGNAIIIGVSETSDPTGSYNVYTFPMDAFPDYPHYAVWPDAYYLTANKGGENTTYAIEKDVMITGGDNPSIIGFSLTGAFASPGTVFSPEPANLTGSQFPIDVPGYIVYLQDDGWSPQINFDHLKVWEINLDFDDPNNSTISDPLEIPTAPFDSVFAPFGSGDLNQPIVARKLDMIGGVISYAANYRSFEDHNSWVITFNVDVDGNDTSGVRWTELRNNATSDWSIFQQGTYAPDDGQSRFMGSAGMDENGNIGLAFNVGGPNDFVGISYTGRYNGDILGEMTVGETVIVLGDGVQNTTNRFGDYSHLTMDPDGFRFWHTAEYFSRNNFWNTRIASFQLQGEFEKDLLVNSIPSPNDAVLSNTEVVTATIRNVGTESQTNFPVELYINDVLVSTENFTGAIASNSIESYTFNQTVDLSTENETYKISVRTRLVGDGNEDNDNFDKEVTHLFENDLGITSLINPSAQSSLGTEVITVEVTNFGGSSQSNFPIQYSVDGGTPVVENFTGTVDPLGTALFSFQTEYDFSNLGDYIVDLKTNLSTDSDVTNDELSTTVINRYCIPTATEPNGNACFNDGIKQFILNTINVDDGADGCNTEPADTSPQGYADRTNLQTTLFNIAGQNIYELQARHNYTNGEGIEALSVWIDFNDDGEFSSGEQLIKGVFFETANQLEVFTLEIPLGAQLGLHRLRAKAIDTGFNDGIAPGDINNPCTDFRYGEVQDYTVLISDTPPPVDVGVTSITSPVDGTNLTNETVTIIITNFGQTPQSDFDVQYILDSNSPVVESFTETLPTSGTSSFTFNTPVDVTTGGSFEITAKTNLTNDADASNDSSTITINNTLGVDSFNEDSYSLDIISLDRARFDITVKSSKEEKMYIGVTNMLGQQLAYKQIAREGNKYKMLLDLSSLATGVYVLNINNESSQVQKVAKIIVK